MVAQSNVGLMSLISFVSKTPCASVMSLVSRRIARSPNGCQTVGETKTVVANPGQMQCLRMSRIGFLLSWLNEFVFFSSSLGADLLINISLSEVGGLHGYLRAARGLNLTLLGNFRAYSHLDSKS